MQSIFTLAIMTVCRVFCSPLAYQAAVLFHMEENDAGDF